MFQQPSPLMAVDSADSSNNAVSTNGISSNNEEASGTYDENGELDSPRTAAAASSSSSSSDDQLNLRKGTLSSASFNILSTMVGGGSLSLPLAFHQAGKGFMAPFLLMIIAVLVEYSIHFLIEAASITSSREQKRQKDDGDNFTNENDDEDTRSKMNSILHLKNKKGTTSYESVACEAFGAKAKYFAMGLVFTICFCTLIGYGVLLRDMLLPLSDTIFPPNKERANDGPTLAHNTVLLVVMVLVTPLCTLRNLTALEPVGAASMLSLFTLAVLISYRSVECNFSSKYDNMRKMPWHEYVTYLPQSTKGKNGEELTPWDNVLNALPILISVFMCHFNVLPVHNELKDPTPKRVNRLFRQTIWGAFLFYTLVGFIGSMYGNCTPDGVVKGNVLLSFDEGDILLMIGRFCLSLTITFAFPILVVPARDTVLRGFEEFLEWRNEKREFEERANERTGNGEYRLSDYDLAEPLLSDTFQDNDSNPGDGFFESNNFDDDDDAEADGSVGGGKAMVQTPVDTEHRYTEQKKSDSRRILASITIFWIGAVIACSVKDIDVIWDILGGSLSLIMGFTMPSATYLVLSKYMKRRDISHSTEEEGELVFNWKQNLNKIMSWTLFILFIPLMFMLTGNAIYNITNSE